ncbi:TPA: hypothetical protein N0F65_003341 [Lagenidium giganteum]|uniref:Uncharacterized protein n=1 Tax=Lagenidium giganteum TaxID=4803 RepID=A0AAV2ZC98_9STRA|nr:TPA: hypothetical protein N0F65_003341 [Lagenidium giganteum]
MGCSIPGLVAVITIGIATVVSSLALGLPFWSTSKVTESGQYTNVDFVAGLWGYCSDLDISNSTSKESHLDNCYLFHTSKKFQSSHYTESEELSKFSTFSVCGAYSNDKAGYVNSHARMAGLDNEMFDKFISRSCGATGNASLLFGVLSAMLGLLGFVFATLSITCCKSKSSFVMISKVVLIMAFVSTLLTFFLWIAQAHPLSKKDEVHVSASFFLSIIASLFYLISVVLVARHAAMGTK